MSSAELIVKEPVVGWLRASKLIRGQPAEVLANKVFIIGFVTFVKKEDNVTAKKEEKAVGADVEKKGEISFYIGEKLAEVFGQYTSLEVGIGLKIPGDPAKFEGQIDQFLPRVVMKIQATMNQIAVGSGYKAVWGAQQPTLPAPQTGQPPTQG